MITNLSHNSLRLYRRLLSQARPYWVHIVAYLFLSMLATPLALLTPLPLKIAVDSLLGSSPLPSYVLPLVPGDDASGGAAILAVASLTVLFALLALIQQLAATTLKTFVGEKLILGFRARLFAHVQRLSLAYHDTRGTADSIYRIQYDVSAIKDLVIESIIPMVSAVFMLASMLYVTSRVNGRLALVAVAVSPVLLGITWFFSGRLRNRWREVKKLESSAQSVVQEVLSAVRVVKAFTREEHEHRRFLDSYHRGIVARLQVAMQENLYTLLIGLTVAVGTAAVLVVGVRDVRSGLITLGDLLLVMAYLKQLYDPLRTIGKQLASKQKALASAERAFALLDEFPDVVEKPHAIPLDRAVGAVRFEDVAFGYDSDLAVLERVSFDIPAGTRVGIVGVTGAGKTTLLNLLTRFYDPQAGRILLDGVDLRDYRVTDLRSQFSIVLQEPVLFSTTIAENVAYGRPGATREDVVRAAKLANAHEFIESFPDGYDTPVGERGMRLSGGERQRISLARAFIRDAAILILDEPTSSVDTATESQIIEAMQRLMSERTTFMIAHRLSTLQSCDLLLRVTEGTVVPCSAVEAALAAGQAAIGMADREVVSHV